MSEDSIGVADRMDSVTYVGDKKVVSANRTAQEIMAQVTDRKREVRALLEAGKPLDALKLLRPEDKFVSTKSLASSLRTSANNADVLSRDRKYTGPISTLVLEAYNARERATALEDGQLTVNDLRDFAQGMVKDLKKRQILRQAGVFSTGSPLRTEQNGSA